VNPSLTCERWSAGSDRSAKKRITDDFSHPQHLTSYVERWHQLPSKKVDRPETPHGLEKPGTVSIGGGKIPEARARPLDFRRRPANCRHVRRTTDRLKFYLHRCASRLVENIHQFDAVRQMFDPLGDRPAPERFEPGVEEQVHRRLPPPRVLRVVGRHFRSIRHDLGEFVR